MPIYRRNVRLSADRLDCPIRDKDHKQDDIIDIKTRADNHAGRFRLIKDRLISRVNADARVVALSRLHLLYPLQNKPCIINIFTHGWHCMQLLDYIYANYENKLFVHANKLITEINLIIFNNISKNFQSLVFKRLL